MTALLEKAIRKVQTLPQQEQDRLAGAILFVVHGVDLPDELEEKKWDKLVNSPESISWLDQEMASVQEEIQAGKALDLDPSDLVK